MKALRNRWLLIGLMWLLGAVLWAQPTLVLPGKLSQPQMDIGPYTVFHKDVSGDTLPLSMIQGKTFQPFAEKLDERAQRSEYLWIVTWLRFRIRNSHPEDTLRLLHNVHVHGLITLYEGNQVIGRTGLGWPPPRRPFPMALPLSVPPGSEQTYYVRVVDTHWSPMPVLSVLLTKEDSYILDFKRFWDNDVFLLVAMSLLMGTLLLIGFFTTYLFFLSRDRVFCYYTLYIVFCVGYSIYHLHQRFGFGYGTLFPVRLSDAFAPIHIALITFCYALFCGEVLGVRYHFPRSWRLLRTLQAVLLVQEVITLAEWLLARPLFLNNLFYTYSLVPTVLTSCFLIGITLRSRLPIRYFLLVGLSSLLLIGFLPYALKIYLSWLPPLAATFVNYVNFWVILGLAIEAFCFMLALAYRGRMVELENRKMQEHYTRDLETQLAERTYEIETQNRLLEAQHIRKLEAEFEQKLAETEMTALRAQMNPHFIFNCLNSIKLYTLEHDADRASEYLTKFSRLIRLVLENSRSERVTLRNELDMLQLYADMEMMRFKQKLSFGVKIEPGLDTDFVEIPPLLLQPYVENAIWHGLMHKPEGGTVRVRATQPQENLLQLTITDDGVGRAKAAELRSKSANHRKSFGMKMTSERIALVNQLYQTHTQVTIQDLVDADGQPAGTEVMIQIPV
ncbi:histidine kinase [Larkinella sp. VNQ87]|uniref:histidine kinase n=1 Tax=Larkinella sp. VNQ87 TaxID=3400921 RepID=UPI003C0DF124